MTYVCSDFHPDRTVPEFCEGCTQPKALHNLTANMAFGAPCDPRTGAPLHGRPLTVWLQTTAPKVPSRFLTDAMDIQEARFIHVHALVATLYSLWSAL